MYYGGSTPRNEYPTLTEAEFMLHAKWMRTSLDVKSTKGAYLVLVKGLTQKEAVEQTGSSPANVNESVQRVTTRHNDIMSVYGPRLQLRAGEYVHELLDMVAQLETPIKEEENAAS